MLKHITALLALACVISLGTLAHGQTLFQDQMTDMSAGNGWQITEGLFPGTSNFEFNWDYSALGIPEAPNSQPGDDATRGLRLAANVGASLDDDQIAAVYRDPAFTGQYTLQVDAWLNWSADPAQNGTTEHAGVYVGFDIDDIPNGSPFPAQNGAGILWSSDGDCSNCDYILVKDAAELDLDGGQYVEDDFGFGNQPGYDNTDGDLPELFPA